MAELGQSLALGMVLDSANNWGKVQPPARDCHMLGLLLIPFPL